MFQAGGGNIETCILLNPYGLRYSYEIDLQSIFLLKKMLLLILRITLYNFFSKFY